MKVLLILSDGVRPDRCKVARCVGGGRMGRQGCRI